MRSFRGQKGRCRWSHDHSLLQGRQGRGSVTASLGEREKWFGELLEDLFQGWLESKDFIFILVDKRMHFFPPNHQSGLSLVPSSPTKNPRKTLAHRESRENSSLPHHTILPSPMTGVNLVTPGILDSLRRCPDWLSTVLPWQRWVWLWGAETLVPALQKVASPLLFEFCSHSNCSEG